MDLKELKKLADALNDNGKQELIYYLQSSKSIKMGLFVFIVIAILLYDLESMLLKLYLYITCFTDIPKPKAWWINYVDDRQPIR